MAAGEDGRYARITGFIAQHAGPNRLAIIKELTLKCESVSAIVPRAGLSQPLVSQDLRVLREHGVARAGRR